MATSFQITDETTSYELFYDAASQTKYKQLYGAQLQGVQPNVLMHQPDFGASVPVRGYAPNRQLYLTLNVPADETWDGVYNAVTDINRMVDGSDSQALRYWTDGDVNRVVVRVQQDSATNYTDIPVLFGSVNIDTAYFNPTAELNKWGLGIIIALNISPYGEGATITLSNDLASSPHFIEDSNADGLADGWTKTATAPSTTNINTSFYLTGGKSQLNFVSSAQVGEIGIYSDPVTAATSSTAVAYVWVAISGGSTGTLAIRLTDGSFNSIQQKTISLSNLTASDKNVTGAGGRTWYRVVVTGTNSTAANFRIVVARTNTADSITWYTDNAYLEVGTGTAPNAWASTASLRNRYDVSSSNEERINYLDTWGIPGDVDALCDIKITPTASTVNQYYISKHEIGKRNPGGHWVSAANATSSSDVELYWYDVGIPRPDGTPSVVTDANRYSGEYLRLTADASPAEDLLVVPLVRETADADQKAELWRFLTCAHRIFMVARSSSTSTTFELDTTNQTLDLYTKRSSGSLTPTAANTWELYDLGFMSEGRNLDAVESYFDNTGTSFEPYIFVQCTPGASGATVDIDAVIFLPLAGEFPFSITNLTSPFSTISGDSHIFSNGEIYLDTDVYSTVGEASGSIRTIQNGNRQTRLVFFTAKNTSSSGIDVPVTATMATELTITPRTRHLLGVK